MLLKKTKKITFIRQISVIKNMILPRLLGILNYHTQKSCVSHLTNYVRSQENTAATEAFNLSLFLFPSSRSWFRPSQLVREKPAPFHFSAKLWLEPVLPPSSTADSFPCARPHSLDGISTSVAARRRTWGAPQPPAWPRGPAHTCPAGRGGVQAQGPAAACGRLK